MFLNVFFCYFTCRHNVTVVALQPLRATAVARRRHQLICVSPASSINEWLLPHAGLFTYSNVIRSVFRPQRLWDTITAYANRCRTSEVSNHNQFATWVLYLCLTYNVPSVISTICLCPRRHCRYQVLTRS